MRWIVFLIAVLALAMPPPAAAGENLLANPGLETGSVAPQAWTPSAWGTNARQFEWSSDAHAGARSVRVEVKSYTDGDAKWMPDLVDVVGGRYYTFSVWYKANANTAVSVYYETAAGGKWANLFAGIAPSAEWTQYRTGFTMPAGAIRAAFVHLLPGNGFLQTDDYALSEAQTPPGFSRPMVSLTFDDGSQAFYQDALPLLDAKGFKTTQYVPTAGLTTTSPDPFLMTRAQLRELADDGHEIGSHTITHSDLAKLDDADLTRELRESKTLLENIAGRPVTGIAYPFGSYEARVIEKAEALGYESGRSVEDGYNGILDLERFDIRGQNVLDTTTIDDFKSWVDYARTHDYWLVVIYHEIVPDGTTPGPYDTTVSQFREQLGYLEATGIDVLTAGQAFAAAQAELHGPTPTHDPTPIPTPDPTPTPLPTTSPAPKADTTPPRIKIRSPKRHTYRSGKKVTIRFTCWDASGCLRPKATLRRRGGKARTVRSGSMLKLKRPGRYVLRVTAKDRTGNAATRTLTFRVSARAR
jgi:peptidoglycan/xylan/chitin deacetylase (PgdA/CDA1 family)